MSRFLLRVITAIQLTRLTIAFGAVSDIWFVILLTRAQPQYADLETHQLGLGWALTAGAVVAVGLFSYAASLNDILDVRHDATFSPERPIPAGRIRLGQAIVVTVGALIVAVLGAAAFGTWAVCIALLSAAGLLFYNAAGKYIPAVGLTTFGLIHAAHMMIPNHQLTFLLPIWLILTHAMVVAGAVHVLEEKRPRLRRRTIVVAFVSWLAWSAVILWAGATFGDGIWPEDIPITHLAYPLIAVVVFVIVAWWKTRRGTGEVRAEKLKRYGAMWQALYGAAWLFALDLHQPALWLAMFAVIGFAGMTIIREITGLSGKPIAWR